MLEQVIIHGILGGVLGYIMWRVERQRAKTRKTKPPPIPIYRQRRE